MEELEALDSTRSKLSNMQALFLAPVDSQTTNCSCAPNSTEE